MSHTPFRTTLLILLLWLSGLGAAAQFAKIAVPFSFLLEYYPNAGASAGWLLTLVSTIGAALGIVAGTLVARWGSGRMLIASLILGGCVSLWQSIMPALSLMMLSRVIEGASHLIIVVAAPTLIAQISPDKMRGASMALWSTFFGVTFALVAWFGVGFVTTHGLPALFVLHGIYMLILAVLLAAALGLKHLTAQKNGAPLTLRGVLSLHAKAYKSPFIFAPALGWFFYTFTFVALLTLLPSLLPNTLRTTVSGLMPLVSIPVSLGVVGIALMFFSAVHIVILGFVLAILVLSSIYIGAPIAVIAITLFAVLGLVQGASFASVPQLNTTIEDQALSNGVMAQMGNLGNLLGTPMLFIALESGGSGFTFAIIIGFYAIAAMGHLVLKKRRQTEF
ncbi:MFS transporter [Cochlodiniinecator piscidefendens]|uniref:MFS transporter n=1 Tax=Cochlodiniinecator piscidefendens TaxID=2715756 RepID=UPI00140D931E|nr:MFS transporter [Cochlodiniinecator piscidefendens]